MSNPSKNSGTAWETAVVDTLNLYGIRASRRSLSGSKDKGDIEIKDYPVTIEAKYRGKNGRLDLSVWLDEANEESGNAGTTFGVVWAHRPRKSQPKEGYVVMDGRTFMFILDELIRREFYRRH